jgi:hypothetical protein
MRFDKTKSRTKYLYDSGIATPVPESEMAKDAGLSVDKWIVRPAITLHSF